VINLHVLDEVALVADRLKAEFALVAAAARQRAAVCRDKLIRRLHV